MTLQVTAVTELFNYTYLLSPAPFFCLLEPVAHVCTPKMAKNELSTSSASSHNVS
jgi:hypothetical protein